MVFFYQVWLSEYELNHFISEYGFTPARLEIADLFTAMFLHGGWMHLIGNMWFLWVFGDNIEDILGAPKYLVFYLLCGLAASGLQIVLMPGSRIPNIGASGAISGVMGAYLVKFPHSKILTLIPFLIFFTAEIPALLVLGYWFVIQFFSGVGSVGHSGVSDTGGVAWWAHVGGFLAGMILIKLLQPKPVYRHRRDLAW
jgi:membrane associated rhomboid family serine protease